MIEPTRRDDRSLEELAATDRRLAAEAAHDAELERPVAAGRPDHPHPDIAAADRLRAADDVRTDERQADVAEQEAIAAEILEDNQRRLYETGRELDRLSRDVDARSDELRAIDTTARDLHDQARDTAEQARGLTPDPG